MQFKFSSLIIATLALPFSAMAAQNEISAGYADTNLYGGDIFGMQYSRYLDNIDTRSDPLQIAPYLQRINTVRAGYANTDAFHLYSIGGDYYTGDWVFSADLNYDKSRGYSSEVSQLVTQAGYFINDKWQAGVSLTYDHAEGRVYVPVDVNGVIQLQGVTNTETDFTGGLYTRYTDITDGAGWDFDLAWYIDSNDLIEAGAQYFFSPQLSLELDYTHRDLGYRNYDFAGLSVNYWFSDALAVSLGAGTDLSTGDSVTDTITASASWRF